MNKLFIVVLALCLISVHSAIVKRDAETATPNYFSDIQKQIQDATKAIGEKISEAFDPEKIKKTFNEGIDNLNKVFDINKQEGAKQ